MIHPDGSFPSAALTNDCHGFSDDQVRYYQRFIAETGHKFFCRCVPLVVTVSKSDEDG